jgi:multimeric flavodoxin WrbA
MSIIAVVSSPRKGANGDAIVNAMAEAARSKGREVEIVHINPMGDRRGCQACNRCKSEGRCVVRDDLLPVLDAIREAEGVILSTPVYFGVQCAQYRLLEDRFYSFLNSDFSSNIAPGKKLAVVTTCGDSGADELADKLEGTMVNLYGFESVGKVAFSGSWPPGAAAGDEAVMAAAREIGSRF